MIWQDLVPSKRQAIIWIDDSLFTDGYMRRLLPMSHLMYMGTLGELKKARDMFYFFLY